MKTRTAIDTKQQILDVAERHFAMYGFAGTSLRGIIGVADVNIAAVAYHFGTKEDLFDAVVQRFAAPVVTEQLRELEAVKKRRDLAGIIKAFYGPPLKCVKGKANSGQSLGLFLGRMQTEPEPIFSRVDQHFAACRNCFISAFRECLPRASEADLQWYFEFMLSLLVSFLTRQAYIRERYADPTDWSPDEASERMTRFCLSGMGRK
ncbi:MAG TPA: TetR/AcrR family transcriptional regulator [Candidatus Obscuribacterales bacterium]